MKGLSKGRHLLLGLPLLTLLALAAVPKPDPQTLLEPGWVLDEALEVNLDGSDAGQIVVISHTVRKVLETGDPAAALVPSWRECSLDDRKEYEPEACLFRAEVFAYEAASGWPRRYASPEYLVDAKAKVPVTGGRGGVQGVPSVGSFRLDDRREAVVIAFFYCTGAGSGCGYHTEVLTMQEGAVKSVYYTWKGHLFVGPATATFQNPAFFGDDPFCCPSGWQWETLALDPATGELGVIHSELVVCTEGNLRLDTFISAVLVVCPDTFLGGRYLITDQTVVEPAAVGGGQGLRNGDQVRVEYVVKECTGQPDCLWGSALVATRITVQSRRRIGSRRMQAGRDPLQPSEPEQPAMPCPNTVVTSWPAAVKRALHRVPRFSSSLSLKRRG